MAYSQDMSKSELSRFIEVLQYVYGPFETLCPTEEAAATWKPAPITESHNGRYLWIDAFGVLHFLTLFIQIKSRRYLTLAQRLIHRVHSVLGYTRDGTAPLPGASPQYPLRGGLRIGKPAETGSDSDGQYHHYLTLWMFALNRYGKVSGQISFNKLAVQLAKSIHPAFVRNFRSNEPRKYMVRKVTADLKDVLLKNVTMHVPLTGLVVYGILNMDGQLDNEIKEYREIYIDMAFSTDKVFMARGRVQLGMTLWIASWMTCCEGRDEIIQNTFQQLKQIDERGGFKHGSDLRKAYKDFCLVMGLKCCWEAQAPYWQKWIKKTMDAWEDTEIVPSPKVSDPKLPKMGKLAPITGVMYCAAISSTAFISDC
ncbi:hypothetical protein BZA77DRAFT_371206 [Pyronema omphalodes]|nr:hypothetical protein BZA77DRAFT_371206 [Pyronema omphalodes]